MAATQKNPMSEMMPVLLASELSKATGQPEDDNTKLLKSAVAEMLQELVEKRRKEKNKAEQTALNAAAAAKEYHEIKAAEQNRCSHRKTNGRTRVAGQRIHNIEYNRDQVTLVCQFCHKNFYINAIKELQQEECPRDLIPSADEIGG